MIIVTGTVEFGEGEIDRLRAALTRNVEHSRRSGGCERYDYSVDLIEPGKLHINEAWSDEASMDAHMAELAELMAPLEGADMRGILVKAYEAKPLKTLIGGGA